MRTVTLEFSKNKLNGYIVTFVRVLLLLYYFNGFRTRVKDDTQVRDGRSVTTRPTGHGRPRTVMTKYVPLHLEDLREL